MLHHSPNDRTSTQDIVADLTALASRLGLESVDVSGFLHDLQVQGQQQSQALSDIRHQTESIARDVTRSSEATDRLLDNAQSSIETVTTSTALLSATGTAAQKLAHWVNDVDSNGERIHGMLDAVRNSNLQISDIAAQVSILAINAKIEAARAGAAGKGFAIVSEAINDLSHKTTQTANRIGEAVAELTEWMALLTSSARENAQGADFVLTSATKTDAALAEMKKRIDLVNQDAGALCDVGQRIGKAVAVLTPVTAAAETSVGHVSSGVETASARCDTLVDASEAILQNTVQLGGSSDDNPMILRAQDIGGQVIAALEQALAQGEITEQALFDDRYRDIECSNPVQVMTAFTPLMDRVLPPIQEPVLDMDERIVFCAVVDRNGYLPTHNLKFSHPQGPDPAWNAAHCRNRRIFDDRVGLKAGRNQKPFLLQVYRRDMGGGQFAMMKDLSVPIRLRGRHWGGLRLAYRF